MTDEEEVTVDEEAGRPSSRRFPVRNSRRSGGTPVAGRWRAMVTVVVVVVAVAVIAAVAPVSMSRSGSGSLDGVPIAPVGSESSSAFCAAGTGTAANTTIYLTNSTRRVVTGVMTTIGQAPSGGTAPIIRRSVAVPALGTAALDPATGLPAGSNATSFVFAGGGVVANEAVSGPNGWSTAPCASQTSDQWSFAGGSTATGNFLTLSLFNPTATGTVVNVSFLSATASGTEVITPQSYQGLAVPPGQVVEENVGDFVQAATTIATSVTALSGTVVSTEFQQWSSGTTGGVALRLGSPALSRVWRFAQTTNGPGATIDFSLANPTSTPATATIAIGLSSGSVLPRHLALPPLSLTEFAASGTAGLPQQVPYGVTVTSSAPVVVGRSVQAASGAAPPVWGASSGTVTTADRWLVPGPGITNAPGTPNATIDSLAVANPNQRATRVEVTVLGGTRPLITLMVAPHQVSVVGAKQVGGLAALVVSSSLPVNVEEDSGPTGAAGIVSSTGFPYPG